MAEEKEKNHLDTWSDIIRRQGEASRKRDDEALDRLKEQTRERIEFVQTREGRFLVEELRRFAGWGSHDPRQTIEMQKYVDVVELELIRRLEIRYG